LSPAIAEKSLVKEDADRLEAPAAAVVVEPPLLLLLDELHAASPAPARMATDTRHARFNENFILPSRWDTYEVCP
jgi:hypothetical protein